MIRILLTLLLIPSLSWGATTWTVTSEAEMVAAMAGDADGDTIIVNASFEQSASYTIDKNITVYGATGTETLTRNASGLANFVLTYGASGSTIRDLVLTGNTTPRSGTGISYDSAVANRKPWNITLERLTISNAAGYGIVSAGVDGWTIKDCTIKDVGNGTNLTTRGPIRFDQFRKVIHNCEAVWDETVSANVTMSRETTPTPKEGTYVAKFAVGADAGTNELLATDNLTSTGTVTTQAYRAHVWVLSSVSLDAGDMQLLLDDTASCASPIEALDFPAVPAGKWTLWTPSLPNYATLSAVISVGVKQVVDKGAFDLYLDNIYVTRGATNTTITGNTISGSYDTATAAWWTGTLIWFSWPSDDITISGNTLSNAGDHGINFYVPDKDSSYYSNNITVIGNSITNVAMLNSNDFIGWGVDTGTISHNTLLQTTIPSGKVSWGVETWGRVYPRNTTIEDNTIGGGALVSGMHGRFQGSTIRRNNIEAAESCIYDMAGASDISYNACRIVAGASADVAGIYLQGFYGKTGMTTNLYNNTIYNADATFTKPGIRVEEDNTSWTSIVLKNNLIVGFPQAVAVEHVEADYPVTHTDNLFYGNTKNIQFYDVSWQDIDLDASELTSDPLLTSSSNFHLLPGSPAINAGVDVSLTRDCDGRAIPLWGLPDIGAYEYAPGQHLMDLRPGRTILQ